MEIIGRITANATISELKDGRKVVNFSIAINDRYRPKGSDESKKITTYVNCSYWINSKLAELLTKGSLVELYGRPSVHAFNNMDGEARANLNFHVNNIKLHGKPVSFKQEQDKRMDIPVNETANKEPDSGLPF